VDQVLGNWGQFEPVMSQPAGKGATVDFRFRNGKQVHLTAHEIDFRTLLDDTKAYLESKPGTLDYQKVNVDQIGYDILQKNREKYIGKQVAEWDLDVQPLALHFDRRITVTTPLQKAGAYLLTARMADGNTCDIVVWLSDTAIVSKPLDGQKRLYFVADAVTGTPLEKANVEFFGWRQENTQPGSGGNPQFRILTQKFAEATNADGLITLDSKRESQEYQWIAIATTDEGRLAHLGFNGVWYGQRYDPEYNQTKIYTITDRPVYRPKQPVKFKLWVRHAQYDKEGADDFSGRKFQLEIRNPKNEKVLEQTFTADEFGGFDGEYALPADATLGVYQIALIGPNLNGGGSFRVEEYKKPEFEVTIDAPTEPVMLGEKVSAKVTARYYFGAPVVEAKVKYKVLRSDHDGRWYPVMPWDWFYGPGYWWFAYDYAWYPGWSAWGCPRPHFWWWPRNASPPEVVAEAEVPIGKDGTVSIEIDTALAKAMHGDTDHKYEITAEVTDASRRTIVGTGNVLVARRPFKVYAWVDRGHYRAGDTVHASFSARTLDGKPVEGPGALKLFAVTYDKEDKPVEQVVQEWKLPTDAQGVSKQLIDASKPGQYRLSYTVTDAKKHEIEGAYVFTVAGQGDDGRQYRFNQIELIPDKTEYAEGEKVALQVNTDRIGSTVLLFVRPAGGVYLAPKVLRLGGKSLEAEIEVVKRDMPNFFIEALTIGDGHVNTDLREIVVPPEKRVLNVAVEPDAAQYKPGAKGSVVVRVTDAAGKPFVGSLALSMYDKAVEYISGGSNVPEIKEFFWKWRRSHNSQGETNLERMFNNLTREHEAAMAMLGVFGAMAPEHGVDTYDGGGPRGGAMLQKRAMLRERGAAPGAMAMAGAAMPLAAAAPMSAMAKDGAMDAAFSVSDKKEKREMSEEQAGAAGPGGGEVQPTIRANFADTARWVASLKTDADGTAQVPLDMPENLTTWKIRTWAMGPGTQVGEGTASVVTAKNLIVRLQAPRFFVEKDEVVLSANIHNYLKTKKNVTAVLELDDDSCLQPIATKAVVMSAPGNRNYRKQQVEIDAGGEKRVDWLVKVVKEGQAVVRMKGLTDEESDAMQMDFPVYVHGMLKTDSFSGALRPEDTQGSLTITVPKERRIDESRLEVRYSPTLAGAMVDALPYLADYPYGCTEQTLNRFLPTVITQKVLLGMGLNLKDIEAKRTNLNAQEIGDDKARAAQWKRFDHNPVFDEAELAAMVKEGTARLTAMQNADGGWGWFSGSEERSWPHTTAVIVHGLQTASANGVAIVPGTVEKGVAWLKNYQDEQVRLIKNWEAKREPSKQKADHLDALVYMVLADAGVEDADMRTFLYRDRNDLSVYAKACFALALDKQGHAEERDMLRRNIEQFLVEDDENQTAYLNLGNQNYWWCWYGSEMEAHAFYLKLLAKVDPKGPVAPRLVKYLLNNRKHSTYWNSTRDTALVVEAFADFLRASGEMKPDQTIEVYIDGKKQKEVAVNGENLFTFDNKFVLFGDAVPDGKHVVELRKKGQGPLYYNAYLTDFTLEDPIAKAGLEVKVTRKFYQLEEVDKKVNVVGARGQAVGQKVEKYARKELANQAELKSGDLVEVEMTIESKNDYEYIVVEDMKAAGFEAVELKSGFNRNDLGAYMELRDERVVFFARTLARGTHSVSYRLRAEIPGKFSALPSKISAMYAPELKGNSDEMKLRVKD
jgi:uncharacterized protein YfaS (alpha-2-macroglobulin family)